MTGFHIRAMQREERDIAVDWASTEGRNPGLHDANCYYQADPQGFLVGVLEGELIGCISAIKYSSEFGFIGFYLVKPEYGGLGYGFQIWQAALNYLSGCNIGLDGVTAQQANYQKSGFTLAYANVRYQGIVKGLNEQVNTNRSEIMLNQIRPLNQLNFIQIAEYENEFFPSERHAFLQQWIEQENSIAFAYLKGETLMGYGVMRQCLEGYKIAPLFANTPDIAAELLSALVDTLTIGESYYLDVPSCHQEAVLLAKASDMAPVFETARMYTQNKPRLALNRIYGVTSFEIG